MCVFVCASEHVVGIHFLSSSMPRVLRHLQYYMRRGKREKASYASNDMSACWNALKLMRRLHTHPSIDPRRNRISLKPVV